MRLQVAATMLLLSIQCNIRSRVYALSYGTVQHGSRSRITTSSLPFIRKNIASSRINSSLASTTTDPTTDSSPATPPISEEIEWTTERVRSTFCEFFQQSPRSHTFQPSSACAPLNDPTLLFTNAGMNQFKPIFLGQVDPASPMANLKRAVNSQKCIRAGGKHNDLEDVGRDTYHHTFFEMLGTWSFGDYFKEEAIMWAFELLTKVYGIDETRLYATYFGGDERLGLEADLEARDYWLKFLPTERILPCDSTDNFWEMGDTGPCGPCSELHYDRIGNRDASHLVNMDDPDVIEIWNIVFIQFNRDSPTELSTLPAKHIDTGMGLERLVSLLQDKPSNYDIDAFTPILNAIEVHSKVGPYGGLVLEDDTTLRDTAYRAISDHARTLCFSIADGAVPNNEGRGYVLRRILRRATRYGQQILKADPGFFATLVPVVIDTYGKAYPELIQKQDEILEIIESEEKAFSSMLDRGIKFFTELQTELTTSNSKVVSGQKAFFLYDTMGFPVDLTGLMAEEAGLTLDTQGFEDEMEAAKERSREARRVAKAAGSGDVALILIAEQTAALAQDMKVPLTDDSSKYALDVETPAVVQAIFGKDGFVEEGRAVGEGEYVGLVLDHSSFYAEAGGQDTDAGTIVMVNDEEEIVGTFVVTDVQVYGGYLLHSGRMSEGTITVGSNVKCRVDYERRREVAPNHTMTHVLNAALRDVLGDGIDQRGSYVNAEKLRFDFAYKKAMSLKQLRKTEELVMESIKRGDAVSKRVLPLEEAQKLEGVRAVFGEIYPDPVRVISVGGDTSIEFCGGTHVDNTAEAQAFAILEETSVAKGIRRISALTGKAAMGAIAEGNRFEVDITNIEEKSTNSDKEYLMTLDKVAGGLRKELDLGIMPAPLKAGLRNRIEALQKKGIDANKAALQGRIDNCLNVVRDNIKLALEEDKKIVVMNVDIGADGKASQKVVNAVKKAAPDMAFMGLSEEEPGSGGKILCFTLVPESLMADGNDLKANEWLNAALDVCGGRGGGKPGNAQGQAKECSDLEAVITAANEYATSKIC